MENTEKERLLKELLKRYSEPIKEDDIKSFFKEKGIENWNIVFEILAWGEDQKIIEIVADPDSYGKIAIVKGEGKGWENYKIF